MLLKLGLRKGKDTQVDLSGETELPRPIHTLAVSHSVVSLVLDGCALQQFPQFECGRLPHLTSLSLKDNPRIDHLPVSVKDTCPKLRHLSLSGTTCAFPPSYIWRNTTKFRQMLDFMLEHPSYRVWRVAGKFDLDVCVMVDPMFNDKDEDRVCVWIKEEGVDKIHRLKHRNLMYDPKTPNGYLIKSTKPWYKRPAKEKHKYVRMVEWMYIGVFDGHNGPLVSTTLAKSFGDKLLEAGMMQQHADVEKFHQLYADTDERLLEALRESKRKDGATAVTAVLSGADARLIYAHVGDSRLCVGRQQLTADHEPNVEAELQGVKERGGRVLLKAGIYRVNGDLSMSRSFGDPHMKPAVCCVPDVGVHQLSVLDRWMVMASDGVWHHTESDQWFQMMTRKPECCAECGSLKIYEYLETQMGSSRKNKLFLRDNTSAAVIRIVDTFEETVAL